MYEAKYVSDCSLGKTATEYCVVNVPGLNRFFYEGDSGSCVLDVDGNIVGMLHSGNGTDVRFGLEITYVAPFEWLFDDIIDTLKTRDIVIGQGKEEIGVEKAGKEVGVEKGNQAV